MDGMNLLGKSELLEQLRSSEPDSIFLEPLLDEEQVGSVSIDLRLGYDFLVSVLTRDPAIPAYRSGERRGVATFFQETRREVGDGFVIYPGQLVLGVSLEYMSIPSDILVELFPRSSFARLGIAIRSTVQPGFRGCAPLELTNHGNSPVEVIVGSRLCQARFHRLTQAIGYHHGAIARKYFGSIRPVVSRVQDDHDIDRLRKVRPV